MGGYRILITDDEEAQHEILGEYLELAGYEPLHAENGEEALRIMENERPDLVLLDIQMPVMDGFQTLEAIRKNPGFRDIPVLLLTNLLRQHLKVKGLESGADDYITKPFNRPELFARIKAALRRTERYRRTEGIMEGDLSDINLSDLLQSMELGSKTAAVHLDAIDGDIFIKDGLLLHARQGAFTGDKAFNRIFFLEKGSFSIRFDQLPKEISGEPRSLMSSLMNAAAYVDEVRAVVQRTGAEKRLVKIDPDVSEFPSIDKLKGLSPLPFVELLVLMGGDLKGNLRILSKASKKGKLKAVKQQEK